MKLSRTICVVAILATMSVASAWSPTLDQQQTLAANKPTWRLVVQDGDRDGYYNFMDCNDDASGIHPFALETLNGFDDDCNGAIDDGFDTSSDFPALQVSRQLWPNDKARRPFDWVDLENAEPSLVWTGKEFAAAWTDVGERLRFARFNGGAVMVDPIPLFLQTGARSADLVWTGGRFAIAYERVQAGRATARLMALDPNGQPEWDVLLATDATRPQVVWGQDRFGVVWQRQFCLGDCLVFQRFDRFGRILGEPELLPDSGHHAAIAWSGTGIQLDPTTFESYTGRFGIAYEANYGFAATADVIITARLLEPGQGALVTRVNEHSTPVSRSGGQPSIAGNESGFAVSWHELIDSHDRSCARFFSHEGLQAVPEFMPDSDDAHATSLVWTGSEYVMVSDNRRWLGAVDSSAIHFRRLDASGNSHRGAEWGPWCEVNLSATASSHRALRPEVVHSGSGFGAIWVEEVDGHGQLRFAAVTHR